MHIALLLVFGAFLLSLIVAATWSVYVVARHARKTRLTDWFIAMAMIAYIAWFIGILVR
jgi:hypothetical protein